MHLLLPLTLLIATITFATAQGEPSTKVDLQTVALQPESIVWKQDEEGWRVHRLFGLCVSKNDTVLAFNEVRLGDGSDISPHHLVLKRSTDQGRTWGENIFIERCDNGEAWANPTPIVDRQTGRIFLFYALNQSNDATQIFYRTSDDDGLTWSAPIEVTAAFDDDPLKRKFHLPGPGHGIQTSSGQFVMPVWHRFPLKDEEGQHQKAERRGYGVSLLVSRDGGKTWTNGAYLPEEHGTNESRIAELLDGTLLLNARSGLGDPEKGESTRILAKAPADGATWTSIATDSAMRPFIKCDAGLLKSQKWSQSLGRDVLIFSRPDNAKQRRNTSISVSTDGGQSWSHDIVISPGSGYSDLAEFSDGSIGLLYAQAGPTTRQSGPVCFVRFQVDFLAE